MSQASLLQPGFAEPVHAAQQVFRRALTALSEPGRVQSVADAPALDTLAPATYVLCLCLLDSDTPVWLSPALDTAALRANLAFHCGCPIVAQPEQAAFALLTAAESAQLPAFDPGTDRDPDLSCTLLIQLESLAGGPPSSWQGPGILDKRPMNLPLPDAFWAQRSAHGFPKGLDCFLTAGDAFVGLPRSTRVTRMMQEVI
ncbi:phosphonate C-P lyase system protein PhnH [Achromobacter sp. F4_2707]|uniref:phosphonate C-P lyase system protein PhnH n=1 Tax=Achromobacter sp. F4_2707 TaxID=3114286 RepID=UPI0039C5EF3C